MSNLADQGFQRDINTQLDLNRSNYSHAFPNQLDCSDWINLNMFDSQKDADGFWLEKLMAKKEIPLAIPEQAKIQSNLFHLLFEKQNRKKQYIGNSINIGFPILFSLDSTGLKSIPIYLLGVDLQFSPKKDANWVIQTALKSKIRLNPILQDLLTPQQIEALEEFDPQTLNEWPILAQIFDLDWNDNSEEWAPFPHSSDWDLAIGQKKIFRSAIIGVFPPAESLQQNREETNEGALPDLPLHWRHHFAHLPLDPSQRGAINDLYHQALITTTGKAGSGKKHLSKYLVINALSNGKKVLFLSGKQSNIIALQAELESLGLGQLGFWLQQSQTESALLLNLLKAGVPKDSPNAYNNNDLAYNMLLDELQQNKLKLDAAFRACRRSTFGPFDWSQTVGLYLKSQAQSGKEILNAQLSGPILNFQIEEYSKLSQIVSKTQHLFEALGTLRHPLRVLHKNIFISLEFEEAQQHIQSKLQFFSKQFETLQQDYVAFINEYHTKLSDSLQQFYQEQSNKIKNLQSSIESKTTAFGNDFLLTSETSLRLYSGLSSRIKAIRQARIQIKQDAKTLLEDFKSPPNWNDPKPEKASFKNIRSLSSWLDQLKTSLDNWWEQVPSYIKSSIAKLNYENALSKLQKNNELLRLETGLDQTLSELNNSGLLDSPQKQHTPDFPSRQQKIESVIDLLENIRLNLRDFDAFYQWHAFWLQCSPDEQALIQAIIRVKPTSWVSAFESWYFQQLLQRKQVAQLPKQEMIQSELGDKWKYLQKQLSRQILLEWARKREDASKHLKKYIKSWEFEGLGLKPILEREAKHISDFFPALLCTPLNAISLLKELDKRLFDLVIIDSAQYIDANIGLQLKGLGKQCLILGDDSFVKGDAKQDLLEHYLEGDSMVHQLQYSHQYYPANLWQLMAGKRITEAAIQDFSLSLTNCTGIYQEESKTNPEESQQLIEALLSTPQTPQRTYPSIAIVTSTIQQRNWIAQKLLLFRQNLNTQESHIIQQMERNGLGIYHLEELEGQRFDHLLFSTTLGINQANQLSPHLEYFNAPEGIRQLSELMATGSKHIHIFHSIPENSLNLWSENSKQAGFFLLGNYFLMIKSLQFRQADLQQTVIDRLVKWQNISPNKSLNTPIYDEIILKLKSFNPHLNIEQHYQSANIELPLVIHPSKASLPIVAVLVDGFLSTYPATDLVWEIEQREMLKKSGILVLGTWSIDWWKNVDQSAHKLVKEIHELWDDEEE